MDFDKETLINWFKDNYDDPFNCVPYDIYEGGYQYYLGSPCDPYEVLRQQFSGLNDNLIREAADVLYEESKEWVKKGQYL